MIYYLSLSLSLPLSLYIYIYVYIYIYIYIHIHIYIYIYIYIYISVARPVTGAEGGVLQGLRRSAQGHVHRGAGLHSLLIMLMILI